MTPPIKTCKLMANGKHNAAWCAENGGIADQCKNCGVWQARKAED